MLKKYQYVYELGNMNMAEELIKLLSNHSRWLKCYAHFAIIVLRNLNGKDL